MSDVIPDDVREFVRSAFAGANDEVTRALSEQPAIYEETLDQMLVTAMNRVGSKIMPQSGAALAIDTHWIGNRRFWLDRWEVADIALVAVFRRGGRMIWRKVALLQSKRLYSNEISVTELEDHDFMVGIGRLIDKGAPQVPMTNVRRFSFTAASRFGALSSSDGQVAHIDEYSAARSMPVYYSLYNPYNIPFESTVPRIAAQENEPKNEVGCRVLSAVDVHASLSSISGSPTFADLVRTRAVTSDDSFAMHGWRLEEFVADEFLACREGRRFDEREHPDLQALMYSRTGPISAAIVISIDLPPGD